MELSWTADRFEMWAEVDVPATGTVSLDLIRASASFPLNALPRCSLTVALGRNMTTGQPSAVHAVLSQLKLKRKVRVYCKAVNVGQLGVAAAAGPAPWPAGPFVVFEGYTLGFGYEKSGNSAQYTVECEHWLADLTFAPATSAASSPMNPGQLTFNALVAAAPESDGGVAQSGGYTGYTKAEEFITPSTVASDLWGDALQKFFAALTREETLVDSTAASEIGLDLGPVPPGNTAAQDALKRFEPATPGGYKFSAPLQFDPSAYGGDLEEVAAQIEMALGEETLEVMSGATVWDKLIQYAATYMFAVAPMVSRALVIPYCPGVRTPYATIPASDYDFVRLSGDCQRVIRGVGVYGGKGFDGGSQLTGDDGVDFDRFGVGGYFQGCKAGQILFKQAPSWMVSLNLSDGADKASGADGMIVGDAVNPGDGRAPDGKRPAQKQEDNAKLMDAYAKTLYVYEMLRNKGGDVQGRFRVDIGPGSVVKLEGCGEKFLGVDDQFGQTLFATVLQVSFFFDGEAGKAGTAFQLAYLRNELENVTDGFSLARHPVWMKPWYGCPLAEVT